MDTGGKNVGCKIVAQSSQSVSGGTQSCWQSVKVWYTPAPFPGSKQTYVVGSQSKLGLSGHVKSHGYQTACSCWSCVNCVSLIFQLLLYVKL